MGANEQQANHDSITDERHLASLEKAAPTSAELIRKGLLPDRLISGGTRPPVRYRNSARTCTHYGSAPNPPIKMNKYRGGALSGAAKSIASPGSAGSAQHLEPFKRGDRIEARLMIREGSHGEWNPATFNGESKTFSGWYSVTYDHSPNEKIRTKKEYVRRLCPNPPSKYRGGALSGAAKSIASPGSA